MPVDRVHGVSTAVEEFIILAREFSPPELADVLNLEQVLNMDIRPVWAGMPRIAGSTYPVCCAPAGSLMLHATIYRAPAHSIIVVEAGDTDYAVAGGNVCAVAQQRGITGFIVDGAAHDVGEIRAIGFPVFARRRAIAAGKNGIGSMNATVSWAVSTWRRATLSSQTRKVSSLCLLPSWSKYLRLRECAARRRPLNHWKRGRPIIASALLPRFTKSALKIRSIDR